jgi:hypothetical protein
MGTCIFHIVVYVCWSSFVAKSIDPYGDFYDPEADEDAVDIRKYRQTLIDSKRRAAVRDELNEVGRVEKITPENLERREFYEDHYVEAHQELFQRSTVSNLLVLHR